MNKFAQLAVTALLGVLMFSTVAYADSKRGHKVYLKKMKKACGLSATKFARLHTQDEWESIKEAGKFTEAIAKVCPTANVKARDVQDVYDFSYIYAKGSGNLPSF